LLACNSPDAFASTTGGSEGFDHGCITRHLCRSAQLRALGLGPRQADHDTFVDHAAFELGKHTHHLKHRFAGRRCRVDPLLMQIQVDVFSEKFLQDADKVDQRSAQPIDAPGCDHIKLLAALAEVRANTSQPVIAALHLACLRVTYTDRGKSAIVVDGSKEADNGEEE